MQPPPRGLQAMVEKHMSRDGPGRQSQNGLVLQRVCVWIELPSYHFRAGNQDGDKSVLHFTLAQSGSRRVQDDGAIYLEYADGKLAAGHGQRDCSNTIEKTVPLANCRKREAVSINDNTTCSPSIIRMSQHSRRALYSGTQRKERGLPCVSQQF